jgi:acetylglutamate kinase
LKLLVKLGGTLLDSTESRLRLAAELAGLVRRGHRLVVVHGGGRQLSRYLAARGVESRFVNGFRVTTPEVLEGVTKILAGDVNLQLVAALQQAGARAVGLTGADAGLVQAVALSAELGAVGSIQQVQPAILDLLTSQNYIPAVACLAGGAGGEIYNVNADQMAAACAARFKARRLIFLTDVEGVLDSEQRLISRLTVARAEELVDRGIAAGGMQAKLRACCAAVKMGVPEVWIAAGARPGVLQQLLAGQPAGTAVSGGDTAFSGAG